MKVLHTVSPENRRVEYPTARQGKRGLKEESQIHALHFHPWLQGDMGCVEVSQRDAAVDGLASRPQQPPIVVPYAGDSVECVCKEISPW